MAAASKRIGRLRRMDRAAVYLITLGGISVVVAVLGILVFIASEAIPLFRDARVDFRSELRIGTALNATQARSLTAVGIDEYRRYVFTVEPSGVVAFYRLDSGALSSSQPVPGLEGATIASSSRSVLGNSVAAGLSDGRVSLMQVRFVPNYEGDALKDVSSEVRPQATIVLDPGKRPVTQVSYLEQDGQKFVAGRVADNEISFVAIDAEGAERRSVLRTQPGHRITQVRIGRNGALLAGTEARTGLPLGERRASRSHRHLAGELAAGDRAGMDARRQLMGGWRGRRNRFGLVARAGRRRRPRWCAPTPSNRKARR